MKQIILERNVVYALWENLVYALLFSLALFVGTTFFSTGNLALVLSFLSGISSLVCIVFLILKKGLVLDQNLYYGYFLFGKLVSKKKILSSGADSFTLIGKRFRQKYERAVNEVNWEYTVDSFQLYFINKENEIENEIIKCMSNKSAEEAKSFLISNAQLRYISYYE